MLPISDTALQVLTGSWKPEYRADAWYDGQLVADTLQWNAGSVSEDAGNVILGTGQLTCVANDDSLTPVSWDSPLACYGSEIHLQQGVPIPGLDTEWLSLGWYVITDFSCAEWWQPYILADGSTEWAPRGTQVENGLVDRFDLIDQAQFAAPEQPAQLDSVLTELARLVDGIVPVEGWDDVTDGPVPSGIVYPESRTEAVQALAAVVGCKARMSRQGALDLLPIIPPAGDPDWAVTIVADETVSRILAYARKGDRANLFNQFLSRGTSTGGTPVQGVVTTTSGPLRFGGPLGRITYQRDSQLLTTDSACDADAAMQQTLVGGAQTVTIPVTVPANPALEVDDILGLTLPTLELSGPVGSISRTLGAATMDVTVQVSREALWGTQA